MPTVNLIELVRAVRAVIDLLEYVDICKPRVERLRKALAAFAGVPNERN